MQWRYDLSIEYAESADAYLQWRDTQNGSEDVKVRMKKNVLSWFGHVERMSDERMATKIYDGEVSGKTFENTISNK